MSSKATRTVEGDTSFEVGEGCGLHAHTSFWVPPSAHRGGEGMLLGAHRAEALVWPG